MNTKLLFVAAFAAGGLIGSVVAHRVEGNNYLNGRLSGCKDIMSVINQNIPLALDCKIINGEVYITDPRGFAVTLDGREKN